jgi:glycosyltransferase involved in cell wall biosynthesis
VVARERQIYGGSLYDRMRYGLLEYYERRAMPRARQLVAISAYVQKAYADAPGCWERINNPVPSSYFDLVDHAEPGVILYAGSITEIKDILTLIRAVERVRGQYPTVILRIAGRVTSPAYAQRLHSYVREHDLEDSVQFLGLLDRDEILAAYSHAAVVALASVQENAPMAVVEAMAAGKPVVATSVGAIPDIVQDDETGFLVPPGDDQGMAQAFMRLLADDGLSRRMGRRAKEIARAQFSAESVAQAYYGLYQRVLASSQSQDEA